MLINSKRWNSITAPRPTASQIYLQLSFELREEKRACFDRRGFQVMTLRLTPDSADSQRQMAPVGAHQEQMWPRRGSGDGAQSSESKPVCYFLKRCHKWQKLWRQQRPRRAENRDPKVCHVKETIKHWRHMRDLKFSQTLFQETRVKRFFVARLCLVIWQSPEDGQPFTFTTKHTTWGQRCILCRTLTCIRSCHYLNLLISVIFCNIYVTYMLLYVHLEHWKNMWNTKPTGTAHHVYQRPQSVISTMCC